MKDDNLQFLLNRFEEKIGKRTAITVRFFDEDPYTVKQIRYNQGGTACYCMEGETQAKQKVKNKWTQIECKAECQYREKTGQGRPMCNEEGVLKFMMPDICKDKIWYMIIKSKTAIEKLREYINFQKQIGNSLIGDYVIFLKEVEHIVEDKKYKNKIVDIIRKEDFISNNQTLLFNEESPQNQKQLSTNKSQNVNNTTEKSNNIESKTEVIQDEVVENKIEQVETTEKKKANKTTKNKKEENKEKEKDSAKQEDTDMSSKYDKCHMLIDTETKILMKDGKPTEYLFANFVDTQDKTYNVIIPPQFAEELKKCELGTAVILDLQTKGDKTFTNKIEYIEKCIKNVAA